MNVKKMVRLVLGILIMLVGLLGSYIVCDIFWHALGDCGQPLWGNALFWMFCWALLVNGVIVLWGFYLVIVTD